MCVQINVFQTINQKRKILKNENILLKCISMFNKLHSGYIKLWNSYLLRNIQKAGIKHRRGD